MRISIHIKESSVLLTALQFLCRVCEWSTKSFDARSSSVAGRETIQVCGTSSHLCTHYFLPRALELFFDLLWMDQLTQTAFQKHLNFLNGNRV